jgi:hypothetical protein
MFSTNDCQDSVNGFIQVGITVQDDVIKLFYPPELLAGSSDAFL